VFFYLGTTPILAQSKSKIKLLGADRMIYDEAATGKVRILRGNVRFKQNATFMYCDSAALFAESNSMKAYGHVKIIDKKKGTEMIGDSLFYDGDTKKGQLRGNISLTNEEQILKTRFLDFDINQSLAYYYGSGVITNKKDESTLRSEKGYYHSDTKDFFFKDSVRYEATDYLIISDTMEYNTIKEKVFFHGPTNIYNDSNSIYCESGWFDKPNNVSTFSQKVYMISDGQTMLADSVIYFQTAKLGEAYGNVEIIDTANKTEVRGNYAEYDNINSTSLITGDMVLQMAFTKDTLNLHSDTLFTDFDSTKIHRLIHAYHHVQFYKPDMQGKCDSLSFSEIDSTIRMYQTPIVWTDSNQITGKEIIIKTYDGVIQSMNISEEAFIVSEEETELYNQVKGKTLDAHFKDNEIHRIDVNRSGQTIYYVRDEHKELMGMNRLDCSNMSIFIDSSGINNIKFYNQPDGTFFPMKDITLEMKLLRYFYWRIEERPNSLEDIFNWTEVPPHVVNRRRSR
jgi:lipopolysaccharide export system protein LptA